MAPDPANAKLTVQWAALSLKERTEITTNFKAAVASDVVDAFGLKVGKTMGAIGGFGGAVNPYLIMEYVCKELSIQEARAGCCPGHYAGPGLGSTGGLPGCRQQRHCPG